MTTSEKILPKQGERNILITSALPYVNNIPHLGNIIGSVLSADCFARYCKARGYNCLYVCGSDQYGTASETAALAQNLTPRELCDKYHEIHADIYKWFDIGFDYFGKTPTTEQTDIAQDIFTKLNNNGYLEEQTSTQPYCPTHKAFLADRYVEGICPRCQFEDARGDQCDKCGNLLDPIDLIKPRCKLDGTTPELRETKHVYLLLDKLQPLQEQWFKEAGKGGWSSNGISITENWLREGLKPRGITRDLKWGTPVPLAGYEDKVLYVWFDACIGYVSITANYTKDWEQWWRNPENVEYFEFMGKDNVPFHSVVFPCSQLGTGDKWTMVNNISTTEYLTYEGGKFSKSRNIGVFGNSAKETGIGPEVWRYYLLSVRPEQSDTQFDWKGFIDANNNSLLKNFGNYVNRLIRFLVAKYDGVVPGYTAHADPSFDAWKADVNALLKQYISELEAVKLMSGLKICQSIAYEGNKLLQNNKLDNALFESSRPQCDAVVGLGLNLVHLLAAIFGPYMPATEASILRQLNAPQLLIPETWTADSVKPGHKIGKPEYLFTQIKPDKEQEWREMFGGDEAKKAKEEKAAKAAARKADKARKKEKKAGAGDGNGGGGKEPTAVGVEASAKDGAQKVVGDPVDEVTDGVHQASLQPS